MFFNYNYTPEPTQSPAGPRWVMQGDKRGLVCEYCGYWAEADETSPGYRESLRTIVCGACRAHERTIK